MFKCVIEGDIELKLLGIEHAAELFLQIDSNRSFLREWLSFVDKNTNVEETKEYIKSTRQQFVSNSGIQAGIWYQNQLCGMISIHNINWTHKSATMGYWLGEKYQSQGIITKVCQRSIRYVFEELQLNRVEIRCAEMNKKSRAVPERLGFKQEGMIREAEWLYDHYVNHVIYSALSKEWMQEQGKVCNEY